MRAHKKHAQQVAELQQERDRLQRHLNEIGMSRATLRQQVDTYLPPPANAHAIVPSIGQMTGASKRSRPMPALPTRSTTAAARRPRSPSASAAGAG